jgi:hypothetical protein
MKYDLSGVGGKVASAILRVYKTQTTTNLTGRVWLGLDDNWTQATAGSSLPGLGYPVVSKVMPNAAGYVDFDVTSLVNGEVLGDRTATIAVTTDSDNWTGFATRETVAQFRPQLVISAVEAVPPRVVSSSFGYASNPNQIVYAFSEDVGASLTSADVVLESLSDPGLVLTVSASPIYNPVTQTAAFSISPGILPDGEYRAVLKAPDVTDTAGNALLVDNSFEFFALAGDADHNHRIDIDDYFRIDLARAMGLGGFANGDFDHSGGPPDGDDYFIIDSAFLAQQSAAAPVFGQAAIGPGGQAIPNDPVWDSDDQPLY